MVKPPVNWGELAKLDLGQVKELNTKKGGVMMMFMMGLGLIVPLLLIGLVAYALGLRSSFNQNNSAHNLDTPQEIPNTHNTHNRINEV